MAIEVVLGSLLHFAGMLADVLGRADVRMYIDSARCLLEGWCS